MSIHKSPIVPERVRRPPRQGWSWIDRRFLREHAEKLSHDAILLYFFLVAVSDKHGLSYYGDHSIAGRLRMSPSQLDGARDELERCDLIAYRRPLYQVLALPEARSRPLRDTGLMDLGQILQRASLAAKRRSSRPEEDEEGEGKGGSQP